MVCVLQVSKSVTVTLTPQGQPEVMTTSSANGPWRLPRNIPNSAKASRTRTDCTARTWARLSKRKHRCKARAVRSSDCRHASPCGCATMQSSSFTCPSLVLRPGLVPTSSGIPAMTYHQHRMLA